MEKNTEPKKEWKDMSKDEKKYQLYLNQKNLLDTFLKLGAITKAQYNKSFGDLTVKMDIDTLKKRLKIQ